MARDPLKRFDQWQQGLQGHTAHLVNRVMEEIVPTFGKNGFERFSNYACGNSFAVGTNCVPLQRRSGAEWATVEILFDKRKRPALGVHFAMLPEICYRQTENGPKEIPRLEANVVEGRAFFALCKGQHRNSDCNFGYQGIVFRPRRRLDAEVGILQNLLPWLFSVFDSGIPASWYASQPGYVHQHAFLSRASNLFRANTIAT